MKKLTVGKKIRSIRKKAGITQEKLAELTKLSRVAIAKYETDKVTPGNKNLTRICAVLNVSVLEFIGEDIGVVRCAECRYYRGFGKCAMIVKCGGADFFCGWGEKR